MGRTIIQPIGPLYGEAVNGTVFGRPNGSVYVPPDNKITMECLIDNPYVMNYNSRCYYCTSTGTRDSVMHIVAIAQDIASYVRIDVSDDSDFTTYKSRSLDAGNFNITLGRCLNSDDVYTIVGGQTYYTRAVLMSNTNIAVAMSDILEVTGYVSE